MGTARRLFLSRSYLWTVSVMSVLLVSVIAVELWTISGRGSLFAGSNGNPVQITGPGVASTYTIQVYVLGAVRSPGVYPLPEGSRVRDLVAAAGGLLSDADLTRIDLAAILADGQEVYIPRVGEQVSLVVGGKLDLNTATALELEDALGLSSTIAERIVTYRAAHGPFTAVSQLLLVPISRSTYDRIKDLVTV